MIGQPFSASFFFVVDNSGTSGFASLATNLNGFIFPQFPPRVPIALSNSWIAFTGSGASLSLSGNSFSGSIGTLSFTYINGDPSSYILTSEIPILSAGRADAGGDIRLTLEATSASISLSPVPLPPALPLFVSALAILRFAAYRKPGHHTGLRPQQPADRARRVHKSPKTLEALIDRLLASDMRRTMQGLRLLLKLRRLRILRGRISHVLEDT
jgi:hypothetical protein